MTDYLILADILEIHADQIARYGGASGVRDAGQLEAALYRPQTGYYPDIVAEGAALWESLSQNHPFIDGNKRTAFAGMFTFLLINGYEITADADEAWTFISGLFETKNFRYEALEPWLRANTKAV